MCRSADWSRQVTIERERMESTIEKLQKKVRGDSKGHLVGARRRERGAAVRNGSDGSEAGGQRRGTV